MTINCQLRPFPPEVGTSCNGICIEVDDGYILAVNVNACDLHRRHAFGHEMAHIVLDHLNQHQRGILEIEAEANAIAWDMYRKYRNEYNAMLNGVKSFEI